MVILRNKNILFVILAQWLSFFGSKLHLLALPLLIYQRTNSTKLLALGFLAETLPWIILAPTLSRWLDRHSAQVTLIVADLSAALICIVLASIPYDTGTFLFLMFLLGTVNSIYGSLRFKCIRTSIAEDDLQRVLSLTASGNEVIQIAAPAIGGAIIGFGVAANGLLLLDALSFLLSAAMLIQLTSISQRKDREQNSLLKKRSGISSILKNANLRGLSISECFRSFAEALFIPILVIVVKDQFHASDSFFGWTQTAMSFGALMAALSFSRMKGPFFRQMAPGLALFLLGCLKIMLLASGSILFGLLVTGLIGSAMSFRQLTAEIALLETLSSEESTPLITAYNSLISLAYVAGYFLSSILASYATALLVSGGLCVVASVYQMSMQRNANAIQ